MSDLLTLFARDPITLTKEDVSQIVKFYREKRAQYNAGGILAGKVKPASAKSMALANMVKSDDLEL